MFGVGSVINSAFGVVLVPVYARHLKASEFGVLSLLMITLTLISIIFKFGLNHAFFRHYYETEDPEHRRRIVGSTQLFLLVSAAVFMAALYFLAPQVSALVFGGDPGRAYLLRYVFLIGFFEIITVVPDSILRASFRSTQYSTLNITAFIFQLSLIAYLVIGVDASVQNVLIGRLGGTAFGAALFFFAARRELSLKFSGVELRGMLEFGIPLIFGQISFTLFMMIDRFFLEWYTSKSDLGVYHMSNNLVSVVTMLVTVPFSQVWTVMRFSVMNEEGAEEYYSRVLTYIVFVSMFLALGVAAVAGDGLLLFGLKSYWPAAMIIPLLAISAVLDSAARVLNIGLTLKKRTLYAPLAILAALAVNIALNFLFIPKYGTVGATVSTLASYVVFCALRFWASNLFFKVHYEWGRVFTIMAVGATLIAGFYLITVYYLNDYTRSEGTAVPRLVIWVALAIKALLAASFPLLLLALRFYDERERRRLGEIWRKVTFMIRRRSLNQAG
ncbi:MAG TPA: oligosaccharide flippase family protein [Blastocatellia bacterium]|nr:oligosaccharide flippase family protein [Blastocatellia bacterium]